ncbi:light-harvesting antenna LH1, alpha subunit [Halochromatium sp.]
MFQNVMKYKPSERDYLLWTVVHPAVWLIPIMVVVLLIALAVHSFVLADGSKYNFLAEVDEAPVAAVETVTVTVEPAAVEAPAEAPAAAPAEAPAAAPAAQ